MKSIFTGFGVLGAGVSILLFSAIALCAPTNDEEPIEMVEDVEQVETVEVVQMREVDSSTPAGTDSFNMLQVGGRLHPALVHMPVGLLLALLLVELISLSKPGAGNMKISLTLGAVTALSFLPGLSSGLIRANELASMGNISDLLNTHRNLMLAATILILLAVALRFWKKDRLVAPLKHLYIALLGLGLGLVSLGGHYGGKMVYGDGFLPF